MKTLRFLLINLFVRDHNKTLEIINGLDQPSYGRPSDSKYTDHIGNYLLSDDSEDEITVVKPKKKVTKIEVKESPRVKTKKDELEEWSRLKLYLNKRRDWPQLSSVLLVVF